MQQDSPPLCQEQRSQAALAAWEVVIDLRGVPSCPPESGPSHHRLDASRAIVPDRSSTTPFRSHWRRDALPFGRKRGVP